MLALLGREPRRFGLIDVARARREAEEEAELAGKGNTAT